MPNWSGGAKGAAGGAALGTSILPGWGTAIGAGVGGLLGMFGGGGDDQQKKLEEYRKQVGARQVPQLGAPALAANSPFRTNQQGLIDRLSALASGQGPSLAEAQLRSATDRNIGTAQSIAQSGRGNATLANIVAANGAQNLGQGAAQQSVAARIAEEQMALLQLGGNIQAGRAADEGLSQFNASAQNFNAKDNLEAKLRAMGLNDSAIAQILMQQTQLSTQPDMGDQLLAGGTGALGMAAGQRAASRAAAQGGVSQLAGQGRYLDAMYRRA